MHGRGRREQHGGGGDHAQEPTLSVQGFSLSDFFPRPFGSGAGAGGGVRASASAATAAAGSAGVALGGSGSFAFMTALAFFGCFTAEAAPPTVWATWRFLLLFACLRASASFAFFFSAESTCRILAEGVRHVGKAPADRGVGGAFGLLRCRRVARGCAAAPRAALASRFLPRFTLATGVWCAMISVGWVGAAGDVQGGRGGGRSTAAGRVEWCARKSDFTHRSTSLARLKNVSA